MEEKQRNNVNLNVFLLICGFCLPSVLLTSPLPSLPLLHLPPPLLRLLPLVTNDLPSTSFLRHGSALTL